MKPSAERKRELDDAVAYAVGHRIRIEALSILNDGTASPSDIAAILDEDVRMVGNHVRELYDSGCIEFIGTKKVRNATEHFYRAVTLPYITDDEYQAMPVKLRHQMAGLIVQAIVAETLASFRAGKMAADPRLWLTWQIVNVADAEGKAEVAEEVRATYGRFEDIATRNANRLANARKKAKEEGKKLPVGKAEVVALMSFERSRPGRPESGYSRHSKR